MQAVAFMALSSVPSTSVRSRTKPRRLHFLARFNQTLTVEGSRAARAQLSVGQPPLPFTRPRSRWFGPSAEGRARLSGNYFVALARPAAANLHFVRISHKPQKGPRPQRRKSVRNAGLAFSARTQQVPHDPESSHLVDGRCSGRASMVQPRKRINKFI